MKISTLALSITAAVLAQHALADDFGLGPFGAVTGGAVVGVALQQVGAGHGIDGAPVAVQVRRFVVDEFAWHGGQGGNFQGFFAMFLCLFALTGIGNGSTFMQVPAIFLTLHQRMAGKGEAAQKKAVADATKEAAAVLGFSGSLNDFTFVPGKHPALHPGQTARIERDGVEVGYLGALHPELV